jgi:hypothetical protein
MGLYEKFYNENFDRSRSYAILHVMQIFSRKIKSNQAWNQIKPATSFELLSSHQAKRRSTIIKSHITRKLTNRENQCVFAFSCCKFNLSLKSKLKKVPYQVIILKNCLKGQVMFRIAYILCYISILLKETNGSVSTGIGGLFRGRSQRTEQTETHQMRLHHEISRLVR